MITPSCNVDIACPPFLVGERKRVTARKNAIGVGVLLAMLMVGASFLRW